MSKQDRSPPVVEQIEDEVLESWHWPEWEPSDTFTDLAVILDEAPDWPQWLNLGYWTVSQATWLLQNESPERYIEFNLEGNDGSRSDRELYRLLLAGPFNDVHPTQLERAEGKRSIESIVEFAQSSAISLPKAVVQFLRLDSEEEWIFSPVDSSKRQWLVGNLHSPSVMRWTRRTGADGRIPLTGPEIIHFLLSRPGEEFPAGTLEATIRPPVIDDNSPYDAALPTESEGRLDDFTDTRNSSETDMVADVWRKYVEERDELIRKEELKIKQWEPELERLEDAATVGIMSLDGLDVISRYDDLTEKKEKAEAEIMKAQRERSAALDELRKLSTKAGGRTSHASSDAASKNTLKKISQCIAKIKSIQGAEEFGRLLESELGICQRKGRIGFRPPDKRPKLLLSKP